MSMLHVFWPLMRQHSNELFIHGQRDKSLVQLVFVFSCAYVSVPVPFQHHTFSTFQQPSTFILKCLIKLNLIIVKPLL